MHFWIDKRSQQCGFGRSRVAASLSGAGGSGVGLSFGHPPRRISSNKSSTRSVQPDCHHGGASSSSGSGLSRTHQYQHHQPHPQQQQQQPQQQQHASNNNNFNNGNNCQHNATHNTSNISSNNITASTAAAMQSNINNNPHQYHPYHHHHQYHHGNVNTAPNTGNPNLPNVANNNNSASSSTAATLSERTLPPTVTGHAAQSQRAAAALQHNAAVATSAQVHQQPGHYYDLRNYHHPQFGNMSLRHYQYPARSCGAAAHAAANVPHAYRAASGGGGCGAASSANNNGQFSRGAGVLGAAATAHPMSVMQHVDQPQYRSQHAYSHATAALSGDSSAIAGGSAPVTTNTTNTTSYAVANTTQRYNQSAINMCTSNITADSADSQLLPTHLKCGMCASLVLASVFVAGAKFYFDHQGTGLEVLIFCAFSATFFLAACTVSLCRVPKGLMPGTRPGMHGAHGQEAATGAGMHCARTSGLGRREIGSNNGAEMIGADDIHGAPLCGQLQLIEDSATAGPPPYHIAIYFPETESSGKSKEAPTDDESPPPSYDKILI